MKSLIVKRSVVIDGHKTSAESPKMPSGVT